MQYQSLSRKEIADFESTGSHKMVIDGKQITLTTADVEIISEDIPGWQVANDGKLTVALDITVTDELRYEGIAREFVNRIQNIRKESGFDVTDKITVLIEDHDLIREAVKRHARHISARRPWQPRWRLLMISQTRMFREVEIDDVVVRISVCQGRLIIE